MRSELFICRCEMAVLLVVVLLTVAGADTPQDEIKRTFKDKCYSIGTCMPHDEPVDDPATLCSLYQVSVTCMESSLAACRMLGFPSNTLAPAEQKIKELREDLRTRCATPSPGPDKSTLMPSSTTGRESTPPSGTDTSTLMSTTTTTKTNSSQEEAGQMLQAGEHSAEVSPTSSCTQLLASLLLSLLAASCVSLL